MTENGQKIYQIQMNTAVGPRYGKLVVQILDGKITGIMEILKEAEWLEGSIDEDGYTAFCGKITSLMQRMEYVALGQITDEEVSLELKIGNTTFEMSGKRFVE